MTISSKRIGFFGGSFNPPTDAHKSLAKFIISSLNLDELHWIISPHNPEKSIEELAPFEHRKNMVDLLLANEPCMICNDIEQKLGSSYTINTVKALREMYPYDDLVFIMGGDNWHGFHSWDAEDDRILDHVSLVIMHRPGHENLDTAKSSEIFEKQFVSSIDALQSHGTWTIVDNPMLDIAATRIRHDLENGIAPNHIDPKVHAYITKHKLYQKK